MFVNVAITNNVEYSAKTTVNNFIMKKPPFPETWVYIPLSIHTAYCPYCLPVTSQAKVNGGLGIMVKEMMLNLLHDNAGEHFQVL